MIGTTEDVGMEDQFQSRTCYVWKLSRKSNCLESSPWCIKFVNIPSYSAWFVYGTSKERCSEQEEWWGLNLRRTVPHVYPKTRCLSRFDASSTLLPPTTLEQSRITNIPPNIQPSNFRKNGSTSNRLFAERNLDQSPPESRQR